MASFIDVPADAVSCVRTPFRAALSHTVSNGPLARLAGPSVGRQGTTMPFGSGPRYTDQHVLGYTPTRKPTENPTRTAAIGGGAKGPHPLREPRPV